MWLEHHQTLIPRDQGAARYAHAPEDWVIGETCWPEFEERLHLKYRYLLSTVSSGTYK